MSYITVNDVGEQISTPSLQPGATLAQGQWIMSPNNACLLIMQTDGNLVLYQIAGAPPIGSTSFVGRALWATGTNNEGTLFVVGLDGSLTVQGNNFIDTLFSGDNITPGYLAIQTDGNLVLYDASDSPVWATGTVLVWPSPRWVNIQFTDANNDTYLLTASGSASGSSVTLADSANSPGQTWQISPDGRILSGLLQNLVLTQGTASNGEAPVTVSSQILTVASVCWNWGNGLGPTTLQNREGGLFLAPQGDVNSGTTVITTTQDYTGGQWYLVPASPLDTVMGWPASDPAFPTFTPAQQDIYTYVNSQLLPPWVMIQSTLADTNGHFYVLTAGGSVSGSGVVMATVENTPDQIWQLSPDGRILSELLQNLVLTQGLANGGQAPVTVGSQTTVDGAIYWSWNLDDYSTPTTIQDRDSGLFLSPLGPVASGVPVIAAAPSDADAQWLLIPVSAPDLRNQYANLDAPLSSYQDTLNNLTQPGQFQEQDWLAVVQQLNDELTAAIAVQALFANYTQFHTDLFMDKGDLLNQLGQEAGFEQGESTSVGGLLLSIFSGILYTVLEAIPVVGEGVNLFATLGNVIQSAINVAVSSQSANSSISPSPFQVAYAELWGELSTNFESLLTATGTMEQAILTDWAKLQTAYQLTLSTGPDSLAWSGTLTSELVTQAKPGYIISVMQMLLPAKYQIYLYVDDNGDPVDDVPPYAQLVQEDPGNAGQYYKYWIADNQSWSTYPDESAMDEVWNNSVSPSDFFTSANSWGFANAFVYDFLGLDNNGLTVTLTNLTAYPMTVNASCASGGTLVTGASQRLAPYESIIIGAEYNGGLQIDVTVADLRDGATVASFSAHQSVSIEKGAWPWIDPLSSSGGYQLGTPICNEGAYLDSYSGAIQLSLSFS
ncbi:hypothetical protein [Methylovulum miyakonense]|uniref:hypothetical protein n=1 Tax=Methylovulum miyakonense TaxID=645578 RepID=UPI00037AF94F|nr:hypothetical protein [Methylovulum miyakonense]